MDFKEWVEKHGKDSARNAFGLSDHLVFTIYNGYVQANCGRWAGSEPTTYARQTVEQAQEKLRKAILYSHKTEETLDTRKD